MEYEGSSRRSDFLLALFATSTSLDWHYIQVLTQNMGAYCSRPPPLPAPAQLRRNNPDLIVERVAGVGAEGGVVVALAFALVRVVHCAILVRNAARDGRALVPLAEVGSLEPPRVMEVPR